MLLVDKKRACLELMNKLATTPGMRTSTFTNEYMNVNRPQMVPVSEDIRKLAISHVEGLLNSQDNRYNIFHGNDGAADYVAYFEYVNGRLFFGIDTVAVDGFDYHSYSVDPAEILYGVYSLGILRRQCSKMTPQMR